MYTPSFNRVDDRQTINAFIHANGLGTLITWDGKALHASHLPVLLEEDPGGWGVLRSHMARANAQWRHLESGPEVLCIFPGPHAYISPSWYVMQHTVPTWNYATVHVYGTAAITDSTALKKIVFDTTAKYESAMPVPWKIPLSETELDQKLKAIVGFEIRITRVEAKFKLGQNRSREDQASMLRALQKAPDAHSRELGEFIARQRKDPDVPAAN
jgi:transcriptional regulator